MRVLAKLKSLLAVGAVVAVAYFASPASAAVYTIDSSLSSITVTALVDVGGGPVPLDPQGGNPAAMTTALEGTIVATVASPTLISLDAGLSDIDAMLNPLAEFLPTEGTSVTLTNDDIPLGSPDGLFTAGEDNIGVELDMGFFGMAYGAIRNMVLTAEGSGDPSAPGSAVGIGFNVTDGYFAFDAGALGDGESDMINVGDPATFNSSGDLVYSLVGAVETITIPIGVLLGDAAVAGTIVASRVIPEPATLALFGMGLCSTLLMRRRQ